MNQSAFIKSTVSRDIFIGTKNKQTLFSARLKLSDKIESGSFIRHREQELSDVEDHLIRYICSVGVRKL